MSEVRERIAKITDFLEENGPECEALGRLTDEAAEKLRWAGVVKMLQPREFGGEEVHPVEFFEAVLDIGSRAGSIGWVSSVVGVHPWEMAQVDRSVQEQIWGEDPDTWIASPYAPMGRLRPVDGPWMIVETEAVRDLDALLDGLKRSARDWPYTVAWTDCLARGRHLGRGIVIRGRHAARSEAGARPPERDCRAGGMRCATPRSGPGRSGPHARS